MYYDLFSIRSLLSNTEMTPSETFLIEIDQKSIPVTCIVRDELAVEFLVSLDGDKFSISKDQNGLWSGEGDPELIQKIGKAIEKRAD